MERHKWRHLTNNQLTFKRKGFMTIEHRDFPSHRLFGQLIEDKVKPDIYKDNMIGEDYENFRKFIKHHQLLDSKKYGLSIVNYDFVLHRYQIKVNGDWNKELHVMMNVELKVNNVFPEHGELEDIFFQHRYLKGKKAVIGLGGSKTIIYNYGYYILLLPGVVLDERGGDWYAIPDNNIEKEQLTKDKFIKTHVTQEQIIELFGIRLSPLTFKVLFVEKSEEENYRIKLVEGDDKTEVKIIETKVSQIEFEDIEN